MPLCTKCKEVKEVSEYYNDKNGRRYKHCKACHLEMMSILKAQYKKDAEELKNTPEEIRRPIFTYVNGYTFHALDFRSDGFKLEITDNKDEDMAILIPEDRGGVLAQWLNWHLKGTD